MDNTFARLFAVLVIVVALVVGLMACVENATIDAETRMQCVGLGYDSGEKGDYGIVCITYTRLSDILQKGE